ncbi:MAG: cartilage oligomeric matrix protein [Gammaproteobacteria bacterium]|nr:MAG: cartilage oligomeric matrix protein [Gammaproteobacteria bacterium]TND05276.1 MAG: cartilage oligomeric matrix protein [Gammaproteobacteria bacterium]
MLKTMHKWGWPIALLVSMMVLTTGTKAALTFGPSVKVSSSVADDDEDHAMVVDPVSGNLYVVWEGAAGSIMFSRSTDQGATFDMPSLPVDGGYTGSFDSFRVSVIKADRRGGTSNVSIVWDCNGVCFTRSEDGGASFAAVPATQLSADASDPFLQVDDAGNLYIAAEDNVSADYVLFKSTDGGRNFAGPVSMLGANTPDVISDGEIPRIIARGSNVYAYMEGFDTVGSFRDAYFAKSTDGGASFGPAMPLSGPKTYTTLPRRTRGIEVDAAGNINIVWTGDSDLVGVPSADEDRYYMRSVDGGATFSTPLNISGTGQARSGHVNMGIDSTTTNIYVSWQDDTECVDANQHALPGETVATCLGSGGADAIPSSDRPQTFFTRSLDGGLTFETSKLISTRGPDRLHIPGDTICLEGEVDGQGNIVAAYSNDGPPNDTIQVTVSTDLGVTFSDSFVMDNSIDGDEAKVVFDEPRGIIYVGWHADADNDARDDVYVTKLVLSQVIQVAIDIRPGSDDNSINLGSGGVVPVAILSTAGFDARTVDPATVTLANAAVKLKGNGSPQASFVDVNNDGRLDLQVHIVTDALALTDGDTTATLNGQTFGGSPVQGSDSIRVVP